MKRRIYLSGGMSGVERAVYVRRFGEAERILRRHGYGCINPCRVWACRWPWIYRAMECAMNGDFDKYESSATAYAWFIWEKGFKGNPEIRWFNP